MFSSPDPVRINRRDCLRLIGAFTPWLARADEELRQLSPPTTIPRDTGLVSLLGSMRAAVEHRDHRLLEELMRPNFRVEFDVGKGPQAFRTHWRADSAESDVWGVLQRLLSLKGVFYSNTLFVLPYVFARFPVDIDPLAHVVALAPNVDLLAKPESDAEKVGSLDYAIVELAEPLQPPVLLKAGEFVEVKHPAIGRCFVSSSDVYNPAGHRAFFEKRAGRWYWISLAAATVADPPDLERLRKEGRTYEAGPA